MTDTMLFSVRGMINAYISKEDRDEMHTLCHHLLRFAWDKGLLLESPFDESGELILDTVVRESSLTERGRQTFEDLVWKWFTYQEQSQKANRADNVAMLEKWFSKMLGSKATMW